MPERTLFTSILQYCIAYLFSFVLSCLGYLHQKSLIKHQKGNKCTNPNKPPAPLTDERTCNLCNLPVVFELLKSLQKHQRRVYNQYQRGSPRSQKQKDAIPAAVFLHFV